MAYDKQSFLSGVAAGRNMESWPAFEWTDNGAFSMLVEVVSGFDFRTYTYFGDNLLIDWGDGSYTSFTAYSTREEVFRKTYSTPGSYVVTITGDLRSIYIVLDGGRNKFDTTLKAILSPLPQSMSDITGIAPVYGSPDPKRRISFEYCRGLTSLPANFFKNLPYLESINGLFYQCEGLRTIPEGFFGTCTNLRSLYNVFAQYDRWPLGGLTAIPAGIFSGCPNLNYFNRVFFENNELEGPVPDLWNQYPDAEASEVFTGCTRASNYNDIPHDWGGPN